jgi:uncharacterized protein (DUF2342 family)
MDRPTIVANLALKGVSTRAISEGLIATLGPMQWDIARLVAVSTTRMVPLKTASGHSAIS